MQSPTYILIDRETANLVGTYQSRQDVLRDVMDIVRRYGRESVEVQSLILIREDLPQDEGWIAEGSGLADLALNASPPVKEWS